MQSRPITQPCSRRSSARRTRLALESLGLATGYAELESVKAAEAALARRRREAQRAMLATLRVVPMDEISGDVIVRYGFELPVPAEVHEALNRRRAAHREQPLADDPIDREIACWEAERESLLDTVWPATSPAHVRTLWTNVGELLGDEPTRPERDALAIEPRSGT